MRFAIGAAALSTLIATSAIGGRLPASGQFDLLCHGVKEQLVLGSTNWSTFKLTLRLDLDRGLFCLYACSTTLHLTTGGPEGVSYSFDLDRADRDHAAGRARGPPPAPSHYTVADGPMEMDQSDTFVVKPSGEFRRRYRYIAGGFAVNGYDERYDGVCKVAPFTGFRPDPDPA